jgi:hypothetical protein
MKNKTIVISNKNNGDLIAVISEDFVICEDDYVVTLEES